ncbi:MAG: hypothetical protein WCA10_02880 [Terracidiphilus sp.]
MKRILLLGLDPETVDFSDPALPPGMTAENHATAESGCDWVTFFAAPVRLRSARLATNSAKAQIFEELKKYRSRMIPFMPGERRGAFDGSHQPIQALGMNLPFQHALAYVAVKRGRRRTLIHNIADDSSLQFA